MSLWLSQTLVFSFRVYRWFMGASLNSPHTVKQLITLFAMGSPQPYHTSAGIASAPDDSC